MIKTIGHSKRFPTAKSHWPVSAEGHLAMLDYNGKCRFIVCIGEDGNLHVFCPDRRTVIRTVKPQKPGCCTVWPGDVDRIQLTTVKAPSPKAYTAKQKAIAKEAAKYWRRDRYRESRLDRAEDL